MIIATGTARFGAGEIDRLRDVLRRNIESTRAKDGCERYDYAVDLLDPNLLRISEIWRDEAAMDAHMATIGEMMAPLADAKIESLEVKAYDARYLKTVLGDA